MDYGLVILIAAVSLLVGLVHSLSVCAPLVSILKWRNRRPDGYAKNRDKFGCLCCGYSTLVQEPTWTFQICPVCYWEDDGSQAEDPSNNLGANHVSLEQARINFKTFGAIEKRFVKHVRPPKADEMP